VPVGLQGITPDARAALHTGMNYTGSAVA